MTDLVACLGTGKGTWTSVLKLAARSEFENVFLIVNDWTRNNLKLERPGLHLITVSSEAGTIITRDMIISQMKGRTRGFEVAVNIDSGTGREHAAMITALMKLGLALRFVAWENEKIEEVSYDLQIPTEDNGFY